MWHNPFATMLCWLHLTLFMSPVITARCVQSFLLHDFCLCQYLFVFGQIRRRKILFLKYLALTLYLFYLLRYLWFNTPN